MFQPLQCEHFNMFPFQQMETLFRWKVKSIQISEICLRTIQISEICPRTHPLTMVEWGLELRMAETLKVSLLPYAVISSLL